MRTLAHYPYNAAARIEHLRGADKLRAVEDRELAGYLLELLDHVEGQQPAQRAARQLRLPNPARWSRCLEVAPCAG